MAFEQVLTIFFATGIAAAIVLLFVRPRQRITGSLATAGSFEPIQTTSSISEITGRVDTSAPAVPTSAADVSHSEPFTMKASFTTTVASPAETTVISSQIEAPSGSGQSARLARRSTSSGRTRTRSNTRAKKSQV